MTLAGRYKLTDGPVTATLLRLQDKLVAVVTGKNGRVIAEDVFERAGDLDVPYKFADRLYQDKIAALIRQDTTTRKWKAIAISNEVYARSDKETGKQNGAKKGISTDHYAFFWNDREIPSIEFFFETARKGSWGRTFDYKGKAVTIDYQRIRYGEQTLFDRLPDLLKTQADDVDCGDDPDRASKSKWEPQSGLWTEFKPLSLVGPMLTYSFNPNQRPSCLGDLGAFENCEVVVLDLDTGSPPKMDKFFEESSFKAAVTQNPPTRFATDRSYDGFIEPEAIAIKGFDSASGRAELLVRWTDRKRGMSDFDTAVTTAYVTPTDFFRPFLERAAASGFLVGDADKW